MIEKAKNLIQGKIDNVATADRRLLTKNSQFKIPNLNEQAQMLEWAGINFGDEIMYLM
jgi:hypothetical protein